MLTSWLLKKQSNSKAVLQRVAAKGKLERQAAVHREIKEETKARVAKEYERVVSAYEEGVLNEYLSEFDLDMDREPEVRVDFPDIGSTHPSPCAG